MTEAKNVIDLDDYHTDDPAVLLWRIKQHKMKYTGGRDNSFLVWTYKHDPGFVIDKNAAKRGQIKRFHAFLDMHGQKLIELCRNWGPLLIIWNNDDSEAIVMVPYSDPEDAEKSVYVVGETPDNLTLRLPPN
jgi:hypothetical protein